MGINLPVDILKLVKSGSITVSENDKPTVSFPLKKLTVDVDILDFSINSMPTEKGVITRLSEARKFAKNLEEKKMTLSISNKGKTVLKLGKNAKPKLSRLITNSKAVEITDLRELRRLDKRLRLK